MIVLQVTEPGWIRGPADDPDDQCAHGRVTLTVNGRNLVSPHDGVWTVSAAGLYLLRTISSDHGMGASVADDNFLFPCCGFNAWLLPEYGRVVCIGCMEGIDIEVIHNDGLIELRYQDFIECVNEDQWTRAVLGFAKQIRQFYQESTEKSYIVDDFDRTGWGAFWQEWSDRETAAIVSLGMG